MSINCLWHIRVDFEYPRQRTTCDYDYSVKCDAIEQLLFDLVGGMGNLDNIQIFTGNACCSPYVTCESETEADAVMAQIEIVDLLKRKKCVKVRT